MKFAKELEAELVPEWRAKYFDYKLGKKKVKSVARALRTVSNVSGPKPQSLPPATGTAQGTSTTTFDHHHHHHLSHNPFLQGTQVDGAGNSSNGVKPRLARTATTASSSTAPRCRTPLQGRSALPRTGDISCDTILAALPIGVPAPGPVPTEHHSLTGGMGATSRSPGYGSIVASPPEQLLRSPLRDVEREADSVRMPSLELPDPALDPAGAPAFRPHRVSLPKEPVLQPQQEGVQTSDFGPVSPASTSAVARAQPREYQGQRRMSMGPRRAGTMLNLKANERRPSLSLSRVFSTGLEGRSSFADVYKEFGFRDIEFVTFLDMELDKIDGFYKQTEQELTERLMVLRSQLRLMREARTEELNAKRVRRAQPTQNGHSSSSKPPLGDPIWKRTLGAAKGKKPNSDKETALLATPAGETVHSLQYDEYWDYVRKHQDVRQVPYYTAKRKLKLALLEHYRVLELLKSYALLNRKAFRKINKKYDKATNAHPRGRYVVEKVDKAWFVRSDVLEHHLDAVEDLYARYFEHGNRKVAVRKLRGKNLLPADYSPNTFWSGVMLTAGIVLGVQGIVEGTELLFREGPTVHTNTSYLFQIYGGYALICLHFLLFCVDCGIWKRSKINYVFVFEYDTRDVLDWRQLSTLPCFFVLLLGLIVFINFRWFDYSMYIYWPVVLIGLTALILFFPAPVLYWRARKWWAYSNWRLLLAGIYPVEFRDFFLGDMYCSQTYSMGNIALFFCLYGHHWNNPASCNSSNSRAMGFMSTLPGILRSFQCIRRFIDTRNVFPHLVNMGKYLFTVAYYMTLSLYRIDRNAHYRAVFITFASTNAVYTSVWDVAMDWSLCNPYAKQSLLRDGLAFQNRWVYYIAMVLDPILRFNWVLYVLFPHDTQHSALLNFMVSFSEVLRRGLWTIFRVENEHCTNVALARAARDVPLPYEIPPRPRPSTEQQAREAQAEAIPTPGTTTTTATTTPTTTAIDLERGTATAVAAAATPTPSTTPSATPITAATPGAAPAATTTAAPPPPPTSSTISRPPPMPRADSGFARLSRMGTALATAHAQDFERRRRPVEGQRGSFGGGSRGEGGVGGGVAVDSMGRVRRGNGGGLVSRGDSSSEDEDDDDEEEEEEEEEEREEGGGEGR